MQKSIQAQSHQQAVSQGSWGPSSATAYPSTSVGPNYNTSSYQHESYYQSSEAFEPPVHHGLSIYGRDPGVGAVSSQIAMPPPLPIITQVLFHSTLSSTTMLIHVSIKIRWVVELFYLIPWCNNSKTKVKSGKFLPLILSLFVCWSDLLWQVTQKMQIPLSYADSIIGTAGANISYMRRTSGATITIQETRGVHGEMTVEIHGTATQVQTAQQLIQVIFFI